MEKLCYINIDLLGVFFFKNVDLYVSTCLKIHGILCRTCRTVFSTNLDHEALKQRDYIAALFKASHIRTSYEITSRCEQPQSLQLQLHYQAELNQRQSKGSLPAGSSLFIRQTDRSEFSLFSASHTSAGLIPLLLIENLVQSSEPELPFYHRRCCHVRLLPLVQSLALIVLGNCTEQEEEGGLGSRGPGSL